MNKALDELIMMADILDASGLKKEASMLDEIIVEAGHIRPDIQNFVTELAKKIQSNERISPEASAEFIKEINDLAETFRTLDVEDIESMRRPVNRIPEDIAGSVDSIKEIYKEFKELAGKKKAIYDGDILSLVKRVVE